MTLSVDYDVIRSVKYNISKLSYDLKKRAEQVAKACAEDLLEKSRDLVPVDTGTLRESGKVRKKSIYEYEVVYDATVRDRRKAQGKGVQGIADPDYKYGWRQHENLAYHHDIGQALYLEEPYQSNKDKYKADIANAIKTEVRQTKWKSRGKGWSRRGRR